MSVWVYHADGRLEIVRASTSKTIDALLCATLGTGTRSLALLDNFALVAVSLYRAPSRLINTAATAKVESFGMRGHVFGTVVFCRARRGIYIPI